MRLKATIKINKKTLEKIKRAVKTVARIAGFVSSVITILDKIKS